MGFMITKEVHKKKIRRRKKKIKFNPHLAHEEQDKTHKAEKLNLICSIKEVLIFFCYQTCLFVSLTLRLLSRVNTARLSCQYQALLRCRTIDENRKQFQNHLMNEKRNFFKKF